MSLTPSGTSGGGTLRVDDAQVLTVSGIVSGAGKLTKSGTGDLWLTGANTFSGTTTVSAGRLFIAGGSSLSDTARLSVAGGASLSLTDADEAVGSLAGAGGVALYGHCLSTGGDGTSSTFSGAITGSGCLAKSGAGTLTLTGTNTMTEAPVFPKARCRSMAKARLAAARSPFPAPAPCAPATLSRSPRPFR
ncbi:autotransporter-associated beta strand repeat-containing protein [Xanthobacter sp. NFM-97]